MKPLHFLVGVVLLTLNIPVALAAVTVDSLNYPAWAERGSSRIPLAPGDRLRPGDIVQTGAAGRAWLKIEDGSVIRLGSDTRLLVEEADNRRQEGGGLLEAGFRLSNGTLRLTRDFFGSQATAGGRIQLRIGAISATTRGSDIWARAGGDVDSIALLEGSVDVSSPGQPARSLDQPASLYRRVQGQDAEPVNRIDATTIDAMVSQTELDPQAGIADTFGNYGLVMQSLSKAGNVEAALRRFREAGYAVRPHIVNSGGQTHTRIQLEGLIHLESANNLRDRLIESGLIEDAWINPIY